MDEKEDILQLGGNIELIGFRDIDNATMIVLKKIVGNTVRKFMEKTEKFEKIALSMKTVHAREKSEIYEVHARLLCLGKKFVSTTEDRNLFFAVDKSLKKLEIEAFGK
ncbi:MAG: hypothetical protein KJ709_00750 [Nanoarchaeota archaeon]|nr:hypothetical protein [Nanoarchaeota archaeon]